MEKRKIEEKAKKDVKARIALGIHPQENGTYLPKQKGWRTFSGYGTKVVKKED